MKRRIAYGLCAALGLGAPMLGAAPQAFPYRIFQGRTEIRQLVAASGSGAEPYLGAFVLEAAGRIHFLPADRRRPPVRLDDGKAAAGIGYRAGQLYRLRAGRLEVMGLPQSWARVRLAAIGRQEVVGLWSRGGWVQLADGTVLRLPERDGLRVRVLGRLAPVVAADQGLLALADGILVLAPLGRIERRVRVDPKPIQVAAASPGGVPALAWLDREGRVRVLGELARAQAAGGRGRPRAGARIIDLVADRSRESGKLLALREDGGLVSYDMFHGPEERVEEALLATIPGGVMLEAAPASGFPGYWALVATDQRAVHGVLVADAPAPREQARRARFAILYGEAGQGG